MYMLSELLINLYSNMLDCSYILYTNLYLLWYNSAMLNANNIVDVFWRKVTSLANLFGFFPSQ